MRLQHARTAGARSKRAPSSRRERAVAASHCGARAQRKWLLPQHDRAFPACSTKQPAPGPQCAPTSATACGGAPSARSSLHVRGLQNPRLGQPLVASASSGAFAGFKQIFRHARFERAPHLSELLLALSRERERLVGALRDLGLQDGALRDVVAQRGKQAQVQLRAQPAPRRARGPSQRTTGAQPHRAAVWHTVPARQLRTAALRAAQAGGSQLASQAAADCASADPCG